MLCRSHGPVPRMKRQGGHRGTWFGPREVLAWCVMNLFSVTGLHLLWAGNLIRQGFPGSPCLPPNLPLASTCRGCYKNCFSQGASGFLLSGFASGQETLRRQILLGLVLGGKVFKNSRKHFFYSPPSVQFSSVQWFSRVWLFATPWTAAHQASLSVTNSRSLPKLMSIESVMPSSHLILFCRLLLLPSIFPSIRVFSNELALCIRWPKYWSFGFNISPSNEHPGLISFRMDWLDILAVQRTLKSLLQHHS